MYTCDLCEDLGMVSMLDKEGSSSCLCCVCQQGSKEASIIRQGSGKFKYRIMQWNGQKQQEVKGRILTYATPHRFLRSECMQSIPKLEIRAKEIPKVMASETPRDWNEPDEVL